jgi:putative ABC transport system permease protein
MMALEAFRTALGGIAANKLRSGLTILGMTIGVASVIVLIAVGNGSSQAVQANIEQLGTNVLLVIAAPSVSGTGETSAPISLDKDDAAALNGSAEAPDVKNAAPVVNANSATVVAGGSSYQPSSFVGTTSSYFEARGYEISSGRTFTRADESDHARVAVIGPTVAESLFAGSDPVGQTIKVNGVSFQVIGLTAEKGATGAQDQDDVVIAPMTAVQDTLTGYGSISQIVVQAASRDQLDAAQSEVTSVLSDRHDVADPTNPGFQVINQGSILETSNETNSVFTTLLGAVAAISLLVGGIGVMNIMLVSVTERTREIGIRKAIGARRSDILSQFLTEAVLVSTIGGLTGVLVGVVGSRFEIAGVQPVIAVYSIFLALAASVLSGLFFGTYPASRAARLRPIEALRFE